jgi:kynurenine formamidase
MKEKAMRKAAGWMIAAALLLAPMAARAEGLWDLYATLQTKKWVDLTHPFDADIPHWKGFDPMTRKVIYDYDKDGFRAELFCHVGQWGTHVDPPVHFHKGARTADKIPVKQMLLPLVVIDVHRQVAKNPDYVLTLPDLKAWEAKHGAIPKGAFVAMRTDWSKRWPDQAAMQNVDAQGVAHYPGWTLPALKYLYEVRHITASGHETTDTDPGVATTKDDYSLESYILGTDHYQIELLAGLDQVPATGALVSVTWPDIKDGTGFPARIFAILP